MGFVEFVIVVLAWSIWPMVGVYVSRDKRRPLVEGVLLGLLGPIGVVIELLLPTRISEYH